MSNAKYNYSDDLYSDIYKDAHGFRPRGTGWFNLTPDEKQAEWDWLQECILRNLDEERDAERAAVVAFEGCVSGLMEAGASDRETAVRWLYDGTVGTDGQGDFDVDYFTYLYQLPHGYLKDIAA